MEWVSVKLKQLIKGIPFKKIKGSKEIDITGLSTDSRCIFPGNLFLARKGKTYNAAEFASQAIQSGAVCIVTDMFDPFLNNVTQLIHETPESIESELAARFYRYPSKKLFCIGVTGTNGKTTTSYLIKHLLDQCGLSCGLISTVEYQVGKKHIPAALTTPESIMNQKLLREMVSEKQKAVVMEASSHALDLNRVNHIDFDVAIFTNLTHEHLDYHQTMERYAVAKKKLLLSLSAKKQVIVNNDDAWSSFMKKGIQAKILTYGIENSADIRAQNVQLDLFGSRFTVFYKDESQEFFTPLIGLFNVSNLLGVIALGIGKGFSLKEMSLKLQSFMGVPGRLQRVSHPYAHVFVDFAHSEDGLYHALFSLKQLLKGRLITIFGCGGDRDKEKRPKMASVVESFSDYAIVTSDNPRSEDPQTIVDEIASGFLQDRYEKIIDRKEAIEKAVSLAKKEDIILCAGKGHEKTQIFAHKTTPFDDVMILRNAIENSC